MSSRFVFIPDRADPPNVKHAGLFADAKDVNNVREVAEAFGVCQQTVRRLIASGELESVHIGRAVRVTKTAMVDFITRQGGERMSKNKSSRRECFQADATATGMETERTTGGVQSHRPDDNRSTQAAQRAQLAERRRTEQQCRDYWRRMYGTRAEIASRGGVSWVGGVRRV